MWVRQTGARGARGWACLAGLIRRFGGRINGGESVYYVLDLLGGGMLIAGFSKVEALERQVERLLEASRDGGGGRSASPGESTAPARSVDGRDSEPVAPRTVGGESAGGGIRQRESEAPRDRSVGVTRSVERPVTAERRDGVTPGPETTTARVIEGVEVSPAQIDSLFRL